MVLLDIWMFKSISLCFTNSTVHYETSTQFFRIFDGQGNLYRNSLSVDVENNKQANPLELYQHRFHILVFMHCLLDQFN